MQFQNQQFLGDASGAIPSFGCVEIKADELPEGLTIEHIRIFEDLFKKHCEVSLDVVKKNYPFFASTLSQSRFTLEKLTYFVPPKKIFLGT